MRRLRALSLAIAAGSLFAANGQTANTQTLELPAGGTLHLRKSIGELTIEGWDAPRVEIATIRSIKPGYDQSDASKWLDRVRVAAQRQGSDIVIDTVFPKRFLLERPFRGGMSPIELEYRIKVPRGARLDIEHQSGEIHVQSMTGEIRATDGRGEITIYAPLMAQYAIDARTKIGDVDSDFDGGEGRRLEYGHKFVRSAPAGAHTLYLRIGFGDILMLREQKPEIPPAETQK